VQRSVDDGWPGPPLTVPNDHEDIAVCDCRTGRHRYVGLAWRRRQRLRVRSPSGVHTVKADGEWALRRLQEVVQELTGVAVQSQKRT